MENNERRRRREAMDRAEKEQRLAGQRQRERERMARATARRDVHIDTSAELDGDGLIGELNQGGSLLDEVDSPTMFSTPTAASSSTQRDAASRVRERERGGSKRRSRGSSGSAATRSVEEDMQREGRAWRRRRVDSPEHDAKRRRSSSTAASAAAPRHKLSVDVERSEPLGHVRVLDRAAKRSSSSRSSGSSNGARARTVKELSARMQHRKRPMSPFAPQGGEPRRRRARSRTPPRRRSSSSSSISSSSTGRSTRRSSTAVRVSASSSSLRRTQAALELEGLSTPGALASPLADLPTPTVTRYPAAGGNGVGKGGTKRDGAGMGMGVGKGGTKRNGAGKTTPGKTTPGKTTASKTTASKTTAGKTTAGKTTTVAGKTIPTAAAHKDGGDSDMSDIDEGYQSDQGGRSDADIFQFDGLDDGGLILDSDYTLPGLFPEQSNRTELSIEDAAEHTRESLRGTTREAIRCKHDADGMDKSRPYERANLYLRAALNFLEVAMERSKQANFRLQDLLSITTLFNTAAQKFKQADDEEREALAKQCEAVTYMKYGALRRARVRGKLKAMLDVVGRQRSRKGEPSTPSGEFGFLSGTTSGHSGTVNLKELSDLCKETMLCFNAFDALSARRSELIVSMHHRLRDGRQYHALAADGGPWLLADFFSSNPRRLITYVRNTIQILDEEHLTAGESGAD